MPTDARPHCGFCGRFISPSTVERGARWADYSQPIDAGRCEGNDCDAIVPVSWAVERDAN